MNEAGSRKPRHEAPAFLKGTGAFGLWRWDGEPGWEARHWPLRGLCSVPGCFSFAPVCPQKSNRQALIEGALSCLEHSPVADITARDIANASGANLASIGYHFGSKDGLVVHALAEGFRRWTAEVFEAWARIAGLPSRDRFVEGLRILQSSLEERSHFVQAYVSAMSLAAYEESLARVLRESLAEGRAAVATLLGLGSDPAADDAAAMLLAAFDGVLLHSLVGDVSWLAPERVGTALARLIASIAQSK